MFWLANLKKQYFLQNTQKDLLFTLAHLKTQVFIAVYLKIGYCDRLMYW